MVPGNLKSELMSALRTNIENGLITLETCNKFWFISGLIVLILISFVVLP